MIRTKFPVQPKKKRAPYYIKQVRKPNSTPAKWSPLYLGILERLFEKGCTQREISKILNVSKQTIEYWLRTKKEVQEAKKRGKRELVERVEKSFYELASGYKHKDHVILSNRVTEYDSEGKPVRSYTKPLIVPITKYYPPNAFACHKILTIQDRENWMDIQKIENNLQINVQNNIDLSDFSNTELEALEKIGIKQLAQKAISGNGN
jgi:hypothetical protein